MFLSIESLAMKIKILNDSKSLSLCLPNKKIDIDIEINFNIPSWSGKYWSLIAIVNMW